MNRNVVPQKYGENTMHWTGEKRRYFTEHGNKKDIYTQYYEEKVDISRAYIEEQGLREFTLTGHNEGMMGR